jgi:hypothetical protein
VNKCYDLTILRVRLGLRFQNVSFQGSDFKMCDLKSNFQKHS